MNITKIAFLVLAACAYGCDDDDDDFDNDIDNDGIPDDIDDDIGGGGGTPGVLEWRTTLVPTELYSTIAGDAIVRQTEGEAAFTAMINLRQDAPGSLRPWHVHVGRCGTGGAIVGDDAAYPRLGVGNDGAAAANVLIRVGLDPAAVYSVNVHYSDAMFTRIIACGDLVLQ